MSVNEELSELDEYYKLRNKYQNNYEKAVSAIVRNPMLTIAEKRERVGQIVPLCVNCRKPGGTRFVEEKERMLAVCNAEPRCGLNLDVPRLGRVTLLPRLVKFLKNELEDEKDTVIGLKISHAVGFISKDEAIEQFEDNREWLSQLSRAYTIEEQNLLDITNNQERNTRIRTLKAELYTAIKEYKDSLQQFKNTKSQGFLSDAVDQYVNQILPLTTELRNTEYRVNMVEEDTLTGEFRLIQEKNSLADFEVPFTTQMDALLNPGAVAKEARPPEYEGSPEYQGSPYYQRYEEDYEISPFRRTPDSSPQRTYVRDRQESPLRDPVTGLTEGGFL